MFLSGWNFYAPFLNLQIVNKSPLEKGTYEVERVRSSDHSTVPTMLFDNAINSQISIGYPRALLQIFSPALPQKLKEQYLDDCQLLLCLVTISISSVCSFSSVAQVQSIVIVTSYYMVNPSDTICLAGVFLQILCDWIKISYRLLQGRSNCIHMKPWTSGNKSKLQGQWNIQNFCSSTTLPIIWQLTITTVFTFRRMSLRCSALYLAQFQFTSPNLLASGDGNKSPMISGDVYIHPSAKVHPTAKVIPLEIFRSS